MAGTMPHAVFIETDVDGEGLVAAYAAELPGCAVFAATDEEASGAMPARVGEFLDWLRGSGEAPPRVVGDNWYEVERLPARAGAGARARAAFSLDELPPSDDELATWLRWLELAREQLADAIDAATDLSSAAALLGEIEAQDAAFAQQLGAAAPKPADDPIDRLYAARDALTDALGEAGPTVDGVRRIVRIAIADDLRAADTLRRSGEGASS